MNVRNFFLGYALGNLICAAISVIWCGWHGKWGWMILAGIWGVMAIMTVDIWRKKDG